MQFKTVDCLPNYFEASIKIIGIKPIEDKQIIVVLYQTSILSRYLLYVSKGVIINLDKLTSLWFNSSPGAWKIMPAITKVIETKEDIENILYHILQQQNYECKIL